MSPPPSPLIHLRVVHHLPWGWWSQTLSGRSIYLFIYSLLPWFVLVAFGVYGMRTRGAVAVGDPSPRFRVDTALRLWRFGLLQM